MKIKNHWLPYEPESTTLSYFFILFTCVHSFILYFSRQIFMEHLLYAICTVLGDKLYVHMLGDKLYIHMPLIFFRICFITRASLVVQPVENPPAMCEAWVRSLGWEDPMEKGTATHSSIFAWRIPWTVEPGRLQSMGSQSRTKLSNFDCVYSYWYVICLPS